jgi:hypothetical protein
LHRFTWAISLSQILGTNTVPYTGCPRIDVQNDSSQAWLLVSKRRYFPEQGDERLGKLLIHAMSELPAFGTNSPCLYRHAVKCYLPRPDYENAPLRLSICPRCLDQQRTTRDFSWLRSEWVLIWRTMCGHHAVRLIEGDYQTVQQAIGTPELRPHRMSSDEVGAPVEHPFGTIKAWMGSTGFPTGPWAEPARSSGNNPSSKP